MVQLFEVNPEVAQVKARVLVNALTGAMDAGNAAALASHHLTTTLETQRVLTFDTDELVDYRAHRPPMTFESWRWTDYEEPFIALDLVRDDEGTEVLLLHGVEPDLRWDAFVRAVIDAVERYGVERTISIHGVPMGVPHTRPTTVTAHATAPDLIPAQPEIIGTVQVPGSVTGLIEYRLGQAGHPAVGFSANVPHYLSQSDFHQAAAELVRQVARDGELALPVGDLEEAASEAAPGLRFPGGHRGRQGPGAAVRRLHARRRAVHPGHPRRAAGRAALRRRDRCGGRGVPRRPGHHR